jgi:hypothetical protein
MTDWREYQEEVADVFRKLGCQVETNSACAGARTGNPMLWMCRYDYLNLEYLNTGSWNANIGSRKKFQKIRSLH